MRLRMLLYWSAEYKDAEGRAQAGWWGRVRNGRKYRYFGPHSTLQLLVNDAWRRYDKEALKTMHIPGWDDVGPSGWQPQGELK